MSPPILLTGNGETSTDPVLDPSKAQKSLAPEIQGPQVSHPSPPASSYEINWETIWEQGKLKWAWGPSSFKFFADFSGPCLCFPEDAGKSPPLSIVWEYRDYLSYKDIPLNLVDLAGFQPRIFDQVQENDFLTPGMQKFLDGMAFEFKNTK
jgi:hypothetical protein